MKRIFRLSSYKLIRPQADIFVEHIRRSEDIFDPQGQGKVVWVNNMTRGFALSLAVHDDNDESYGHQVFPAFIDIDRFEQSFAQSELKSFAESHPFVLHRMGYYQSYGVRDLWCISNDGSIISPSSEAHISFERKYIFSSGQGNNPEFAIRKLLDTLLRETPSAYFFLHKLGASLDIDLVIRYISLVPEYKTVASQIQDSTLPAAQEANVRALLETEQTLLADPVGSYRALFAYEKEKRNRCIHYLFGDGTCLGFNNQRAMRGLIRMALRRNPDVVLFVHEMGSAVDFSLVERLKNIRILEDMIERPERSTPDGSIV